MTRLLFRSMLMAGGILLSAGGNLLAQQGRDWVGIPTTLQRGVTVSVAELQRRSDSADRSPGIRRILNEKEYERHPRINPQAPSVSVWPPESLLIERPSTTARTDATQVIYSNFLASNYTGDALGFAPPDSNGDLSTTQVGMANNGRIRFYNKNSVCAGQQTSVLTTTTTNLAPVVDLNLSTFYASVTSSGISDPHIRYDRLTNRWFIVAIDVAAASNKCVIAVSSGPTITGLASFTFFSFVFDSLLPLPAGYAGGFFDYPTLGVDANALYIGGRMFGSTGSYVGASVFVVRKSSILGAGPIVVTGFNGIGTSTAGVYTPQGVQNDDPAASEGYVIGVDNAAFSTLDIHRISTPGGTPVASAVIKLTVPTTSIPLNPTSSGSAAIDANDDRLFAAMIKKDPTTGTPSLWTSHAIAVTAAGVGATSGTGRRDAIRWYQIGTLSATPTLLQSGTLFDNAASTPRFFWFPSIAMSGQGHVVMGSSSTASNQFIDVAVAGRYYGDAAGTQQPYTLATTSSTSYTLAIGTPRRWGDYSQTVVDPSDDMTMWTFQQYCNAAGSYGTRAVQLKAPAPATPVAPGTIGCGNSAGGGNRSTAVTLNGTSVSNSGFFDPGAGFANRLTVTTTGSGASISSLVYVNPTKLTFNLIWPPALAGTTQTLTITNPDCQSVTVNYTLPVGCAPLPVQWLSFTGKPAGRKVELDWITDLEPENQYFELERKNADGSYSVIGQISSKGLNGGNYQYFDNTPEAINFYRLKQYNTDRSFSYSPVVRVDLAGVRSLTIYPNPAKDQLTVEMPDAFRKGMIRLINASGAVVYSAKMNNGIRKSIDVSSYPAGTYVVELESETGERAVSSVIVQHNEPMP